MPLLVNANYRICAKAPFLMGFRNSILYALSMGCQGRGIEGFTPRTTLFGRLEIAEHNWLGPTAVGGWPRIGKTSKLWPSYI